MVPHNFLQSPHSASLKERISGIISLKYFLSLFLWMEENIMCLLLGGEKDQRQPHLSFVVAGGGAGGGILLILLSLLEGRLGDPIERSWSPNIQIKSSSILLPS